LLKDNEHGVNPKNVFVFKPKTPFKARLHARSISLHMLRSRYRLPGTDPHGWRVWVASPSPGRATGHSLVLWDEAEM
jgi:hypothetical protein